MEIIEHLIKMMDGYGNLWAVSPRYGYINQNDWHRLHSNIMSRYDLYESKQGFTGIQIRGTTFIWDKNIPENTIILTKDELTL